MIESVSNGVPTALAELRTLGRTLKKRAEDVRAYFDRPGTSNGPTEAMNGRLEHLRGSALGFRGSSQLRVWWAARRCLGRGRGLPRMGVLTLPTGKTSTCLTLHSPALT